MASSHATPFSGSWYPGRPADLEALLDRLFDSSLKRTGPALLPRPLAFVVPHAGLAYSGTVAASAYRHLQAAKPERVFILGFTHQGGRPGVSIPDIDAFETPLGEVTVDRAAAREMASGGQFAMVAEAQVCDHSVEIQLPLLEKAVAGVPVVPLYVGPLNDAGRRAAAQALAQRVRPGDVLLASSDLTHYGRSFGYQPFPAGPDVSRRLFQLDSRVIDAAGSLAPTLFLDTLQKLDSTVCGYQPVALLLETLGLLPGEEVFQQTLDYQTSADITGDFKHVVSYGSLGHFRADSFQLDEEAQGALLLSARATLRHLSATGERKPIPPAAASPLLMRRAGVFVSLHQGRELFGCIGLITAETPLAEAVPNLTLDAALDDPRFARRSSVPDGLKIEISVLTPMKRIRDWRSFQIGRHGAYLESGGHSGLLLPQVATHGAFTQSSFLEALSRKAGLRPGAYQDPQARLSVFQAQVFGDGC
ncbi:MAG: AmmeMemoRadiSam system protein B [Bryobacteraceae bacterium]|jgi:AmmeMemoRadiSam system protein B/AmmeMemoRadiSam system protein A